ncbi:MAG TPA: hypothetical protein VN372_06990 [Methanospirillum sp.]|nr:hypothetical protein [Methanospirillum sp.]
MILVTVGVFGTPCISDGPAPGMSYSWTNWNMDTVQNGPPQADTTFTIQSPVLLTSVETYHGNDGKDMDHVGTIGLTGTDGTVYGPWEVQGYPGITLNKDAHWVTRPNIDLPAGTYVVKDSDPATWSFNEASGLSGFAGVNWKDAGITASTSGSEGDPAWVIVEDPNPSEPSAWVIKDGIITHGSNTFRTDNEYDFFQGTHIVSGSPDDGDYVLSCTMKADDNDGMGAIVRYQDKDNYYRFISLVDPANKGPFTRLEKFEDGKRTVIDETNRAYEPGREFHVEFSAVGNTLDVTFDKEPMVHGIDNTFTSGKVGFLTYAQTGFRVSDISVTPAK